MPTIPARQMTNSDRIDCEHAHRARTTFIVAACFFAACSAAPSALESDPLAGYHLLAPAPPETAAHVRGSMHGPAIDGAADAIARDAAVDARKLEDERADGAVLLVDTQRLVRWLEQHSAAVMAGRAVVAQSASELGQSRLAPNPGLDLGWGGINVGAKNPSSLSARDSQNYSFGLHQTIELGKRTPRIEGAKLRLDAERERYVGLLSDTVGRARLALGRALFLQSRIHVLEESLASAKQLADVEHSRLDHGDISGNDYDRLALDTLLLELEMPKSQAELEEALGDARTALGSKVELGSADPELLGKAGAIDRAQIDVDDAITHRPDHQTLGLEMAAAQKDMVLARNRSIPDLQIGAAYTHDNLTEAGNQPDTLALTLGIDLPIFDHGQHEAAKAQDRALELSYTRAESLRDATADAHALFEHQSALERILERVEGEALPKSKQVLDATSGAYNRGELRLTDVLLAQRTHTDLVLKHMDLQFESFSVRNQLRAVLGLDGDVVRATSEKK